MAVVETERNGQVFIVRMNRPERLNALNTEMRQMLAEIWTEFRRSKELEVAIFTGTGRGFCAGEDMKESLATGKPGGTRPKLPDPFMDGTLEKPVIAAVNGFAMGGGFMLVERTDLRVAVPEAVFEVSEAKRWLLGGYNHGHLANVPYPIAMEMALGFRFTAERFYQVGFLNRLVPLAVQQVDQQRHRRQQRTPRESRMDEPFEESHVLANLRFGSASRLSSKTSRRFQGSRWRQGTSRRMTRHALCARLRKRLATLAFRHGGYAAGPPCPGGPRRLGRAGPTHL